MSSLTFQSSRQRLGLLAAIVGLYAGSSDAQIVTDHGCRQGYAASN